MKYSKLPMMQVSILLLALTVRVWTDTYCVSEEKSSFNEHCQESHPLKWFVNNTVGDHSKLLFLPGTHYLNSSETNRALIAFHNKYNLSLTGKSNYSIVVCNGSQSGFFFNYSINICLNSLEFQGCSAHVKLTTHENSSFFGGVFFHLSYDITISQVCIRGSKGYGLHMDNICGSIVIEHSQFVANENGNAVLWFNHCASENVSATTVKIYKSEFLHGHSKTQNGTGLYLLLIRQHVQITLSYCNLTENKGIAGGNMAIRYINYEQDTGYVKVENTNILNGHSSGSGGGIFVYFERNSSDLNYCNRSNLLIKMLTIRNTIISNNTANQSGGGLHLAYNERPGFGCITREIEIINCTLSYNNALSGSALEITKHKLPSYKQHFIQQLSVCIIDCEFFGNILGKEYSEDGIVETFSVDTLLIQDTVFINNKGTALMLVNSGVQLNGSITFKDNSAQYGGAVKICESSQMYLNTETRVKFLNNSAALAGGAIYSGAQCLTETPPCFFQVSPYNGTIVDLPDHILYFEGNHAGIAGNAIYGGSVDHCFTNGLLRFNESTLESYYYSFQLYKSIFKFSDNEEPSKVTSDPYGICLCKSGTNQVNCTNRIYYAGEVYPGEHIHMYLTAVGQTKGAVPSYMEATVPNQNETYVFMTTRNKSINELKVFCRNVEIYITSMNQTKCERSVKIYIGVKKSNFVSESSNYYQIPKLIVNVTLKPCPFLFQLVRGKCDCPSKLRNLRIKCDIDSQTVLVPPATDKKHTDRGVWIGCDYNHTTEKCDKYEGSDYCQKDHCSPHNAYFNQDNLTLICKEGRGGRLCSKCQKNYTLSLGTSDCILNIDNCHVWSTFLLCIIFVLAGILLVCFFTMFNFTVAEGTIHGLLLYANCIQIIQYPLFNDSLHPVARVFISWLNLDFGFEVCFYSGMTAYHKIWLEFGFLLYLLLLGVMIVCLSRRFVWFTRLAGRNVVPVLATIAFCAYPKLVRNSIRVWECHQNYVSSDNYTPFVWYMDETIECFSKERIVLFVASIPLFMMASLYMLCLLLIQCLQRRSNWFVLRWVDKLRPFFDAHTGPCHDHYRFWPGLLLFAKMGLYLVFWGIDIPSNKAYAIAGLCVLLFFLACIFPRGVYKSWPLNVLDFSFIFNLGITAAFVGSDSFENVIVGWVSISIAALTFTFIIAYHTFKRVRETRCWKRFFARIKAQRYIHQITESNESTPLLVKEQGLPRVVQFSSLREPLLEDV